MSKRVCPTPGCPNLQPCPEHKRASAAKRGYGRAHRAVRNRMKPAVEAGTTTCARCGEPIRPGQAWAPDHNGDRTGYLGPSHALCNNRAGGRAAHGG